jgi:hypothetical protein
MAVLLSYNEADSWTVANLVKATQIKEDLLVQVVGLLIEVRIRKNSCYLRSLATFSSFTRILLR